MNPSILRRSQKPPADPGLIGDQKKFAAMFHQRLQGRGDPGEQPHLSGIGQIVPVLNQSPVPIQQYVHRLIQLLKHC